MTTVHTPQVEVLPDCLLVTDLAITDERAIALVRRAGDEVAAAVLLNMISVGATGLEAMSDAQHLDFVREQVSGLMIKTERAVDRLGECLIRQADEKFDPAQSGSYSHQIASEVNRARVELTHVLTASGRTDQGGRGQAPARAGRQPKPLACRAAAHSSPCKRSRKSLRR